MKTRPEIEEHIILLKKECKITSNGLPDNYFTFETMIEALKWVLRSHADEKKLQAKRDELQLRTIGGKHVQREVYTKPRRRILPSQ